MATNRKKNWNEIYAEQVEASQRRLDEYNETLSPKVLIPSETVYLSNEELGEPVYSKSDMHTNAKVIRERMKGMKVGEWAYFPEMSFPERKGEHAYNKERARLKLNTGSEIRRIAKELGFTVKVGFARAKGGILTPSVEITGKRGS